MAYAKSRFSHDTGQITDDGLSLPLTNEMDSDIVGETVVVTTSPEEEDVVVTTSPEEEDVNASGDSDLEELNEVDKESLMDKAAGGQSETVDAPDVESQAYTR